MATQYREYAGGIRLTLKPDARGYYRIKYPCPDTGRELDKRRRDLAVAERLAAELSHHAVTGQTITHDGRLVATHTGRTIAELAEWFLDPASRGTDWAPSTVDRYRSLFGAHILPMLGDLPCCDLTDDHVRSLREHLRCGRLPSTAANYWRVWVTMCNLGVRDGFFASDPNARVTMPNKAPSRRVDADDIPSHDWIGKLAAALVEHGDDERFRAMVLLGAYSGLRISEVFGVRVEDLDFRTGMLTVERQRIRRKGETVAVPLKGRTEVEGGRTTLLPGFTHDAMHDAASRAVDGWLFPGPDGGAWSRSTFYNQYLYPAFHGIGWPRQPQTRPGSTRWHWTFHSLRHAFCTWALTELRLDVADVSRMAGHRSTAFTFDVYVGQRAGLADRAAAALAAAGAPV